MRKYLQVSSMGIGTKDPLVSTNPLHQAYILPRAPGVDRAANSLQRLYHYASEGGASYSLP
jgi:hypothetical protein